VFDTIILLLACAVLDGAFINSIKSMEDLFKTQDNQEESASAVALEGRLAR
jgi:hypothetical protein